MIPVVCRPCARQLHCRGAQVEKRYNYTTPKTFLELIKLYKSLLARQRKAVGGSIERLKSGLNKLQMTQHEVDVLVEEASLRATQVAEKVAEADAFAEQVGFPSVEGGREGV